MQQCLHPTHSLKVAMTLWSWPITQGTFDDTDSEYALTCFYPEVILCRTCDYTSSRHSLRRPELHRRQDIRFLHVSCDHSTGPILKIFLRTWHAPLEVISPNHNNRSDGAIYRRTQLCRQHGALAFSSPRHTDPFRS